MATELAEEEDDDDEEEEGRRRLIETMDWRWVGQRDGDGLELDRKKERQE